MEETIRDLILKTQHPHYTYHLVWSWAVRRVWLASHNVITVSVLYEEIKLVDYIARKHVEHLEYQWDQETGRPARRRRTTRRTTRDGSGDRRPSPDTAS